MDVNNLKEKLHTELKEIVYTNRDPEKIGPQQLQSGNGKNSFLYVTAVIADLLIFVVGTGFSWTSPAFSYLSKTDPELNPLGQPITSVQESWIAALYCLGAAIGPLFAGKLADSLGRKRTLITVAVPLTLSLILLAYATNIWLYYITRFVMGLSAGSTFAILPIYLAEISEVHNKGEIGCMMGILLTLGALYPFAVGSCMSLRLLTLTCAAFPILFLILSSLLIPESPIYLVKEGKFEEAEKAFEKLRYNDPLLATSEVKSVQERIKNERQESNGETKHILGDRGVRKAFIISIGLLMSQQLSGINAVVAFLQPIFEASKSSLSPYVSTVIIGIIQVLGTVVAASLVEKLGRKILLLASCLLSGGSIILLGLYFYLNGSDIFDVSKLFWLPIASLMIYIVSFNMGLGSLPWTITSEIFPSNVQSTASSVGSFACFMTSFAVTLCFPILVNSIGMAKCFWLFGAFLAVITIFISTMVPETKGKTSAEIQTILRG